tara:strand:+ start:307 stop:642 length:336 start_codon:yes stop_codon:yes gene_type:complete
MEQEVIPQSTEDIREYMLQIVLPSADVMTSHGQDHPDMALPSMKELIDDLELLHKNGIGQDAPIYASALTALTTYTIAHYEHFHRVMLNMGYPLPDSDDMALGINQIPKGE